MWTFTPEILGGFSIIRLARGHPRAVRSRGPMIHRRFLPVYAFAAVLIGISMVTRLALLLRPDTALAGAAEILRVLAIGLGYDLAAAAYFCAPFALYLAL